MDSKKLKYFQCRLISYLYLVMSTLIDPTITESSDAQHTVLLPEDYVKKFDPDEYLQFYFSRLVRNL